jgi:hypothetical protein
MTYKILNDYGGYEGMKWFDDVEYPSISEAVKVAINSSYGVPFHIVTVHDWEAKHKNE